MKRRATALSRGSAWVLGEASVGLRAQGRLQEALASMRDGLRNARGRKDWKNAATQASNLSETELLLGEIGRQLRHGEKAVALADRSRR